MENKVSEKEIMLGNWFTHESKENSIRKDGEFQWEDIDWYHLIESKLDIGNVSPIPLTKNWFKDFDFGYDKLWDEYSKSGISIYWDKGFEYFCYYNKGKETILKYVHQLQNLYFILNSGEELTRKSKN